MISRFVSVSNPMSMRCMRLVVGYVMLLSALCTAEEDVPTRSADEIAKKIIEGKRHDSELSNELYKLDPAERNPALVEVVLRGNPARSVSAATLLIHVDAAETAPTIAKHIVTLSAERQVQILGRLWRLHRSQEPWLHIPRAVLEALPQRAGPDPILQTPRFSICDPLGSAALLLTKSKDRGDHQLVRSALSYDARSSWKLWLACTKLRLQDEALRKLAVEVMRDTTLSEFRVRIAAATAIADVDENALDVVVAEVAAFIARYREQSTESMLAGFMTSATSLENKAAFMEYQTDLLAIGFLQFLKDERTQDLLADALSAKNSQLAMTAAAVLLQRSPKILTQYDLSHFSDDDYALLVAAATFLHPSLDFSVRATELLTKIEEAKGRIESQGLAVALGPAGRCVFGLR